ncbi:MAG: RagB/SusD family nutrient uptake outer membrane protein [Salinibacter sp.]
MQNAPFRRSLIRICAAVLLLTGAGCELNITNPNAPSEEEVLTSPEGIRGLAVGMQEFYATEAFGETIRVTGTTSRELAANNTRENFRNLDTGGTGLPPRNAGVESIWSANYRVVAMAEDLIQNAPDVGLSQGTQTGILATARLFKAMALGNVASAFEQAPTSTNRNGNAQFVSRTKVYQEAVALLNEARSAISGASNDQLSRFGTDVLALTPSGTPPKTLLLNAINAYLARFNLYAGNYQAAIDAANQVDPSVKVQFTYDGQSRNPVWFRVVDQGFFKPRDNFGTKLTESGDQRIDFYTSSLDSSSIVNGYPIDKIDGFFTSVSSPIPLYVPGEMPLIRAEAKLETGAPTSEVISEIDAVRTKTPSQDIYGIGANLPPYSGDTSDQALRREILQQRRAELYLQGVALADSRRLGPDVSNKQNPGPFERNRNFYPYPQQERRNNPNTPENPNF